MTQDRDALRRQLRQRRRDIAAPERIAAAERLAGQLAALPLLPERGHVAGYWAMQGEIGLHAWQVRLPPSLTYCLPVLHADEVLRFAPWKAGEALVLNRYGIPEPDIDPEHALPASAMALVAMPLVGFDDRGHRLGMGGGWYDRTFAFRRAQAAPPWLVGVGFALQQVATLENQPWDVPLDAACTEQATLLFSPPAAGNPA